MALRALSDAARAIRGIAYVLRRFIPQQRDIAVLLEHIVQSGERPDLLAAGHFGDAELYWRIADANAVIDPFELTDTLGARVGDSRADRECRRASC